MVHASSLRVIGQALEVADVRVFELEKHGQYYVVWSDSLANAENGFLTGRSLPIVMPEALGRTRQTARCISAGPI